MSILRTPYPHILPDDAAVWARWIKRYEDQFALIEYDVRVGLGRDPGPEHTPNIREMAIGLSQRRIDAVGHRSTGIFLFEITRVADLKCLGQVAAYPTLYLQTYTPEKPLRMCVVAEAFGTDMETAFRMANCTVYIV